MAAPAEIVVKWGGDEYKISGLKEDQTVKELKLEIKKQTGVLPERQKLLGLKYKGKVPGDEVALADLKLKPSTKIMMMGTREEEITKVVEPPPDMPEVVNIFQTKVVEPPPDMPEEVNIVQTKVVQPPPDMPEVVNIFQTKVVEPPPDMPEVVNIFQTKVVEPPPDMPEVVNIFQTKVVEPPPDMPEVVNDFDIEEEEIAIESREEYLSKIEKRVKDLKIDMLNEPRDGKKLLVLDIDYTLFDHRSVAESANELIRPFLHEFLISSYEDYDIVIWSATGMKWIEVKMKELGVSTHAQYKLCFMLDSSAMISIHTPKYGVIEVKPLGVIWGRYPRWGPHNTIMFDDIRRNFIMNPQTGLRIRPFRQAHFNRDKDRELLHLAKYLKDIATVDDFTSLNHKKWEKYRSKRKHKESDSEVAEGAGDQIDKEETS